jgi:hypothetical protein
MYTLYRMFQIEHNILVTRSASPSSADKVKLVSRFYFLTLNQISFTVLITGRSRNPYGRRDPSR